MHIETLAPLYDYIYDLTGLTFPAANRETMDKRVQEFLTEKSIDNCCAVDFIKTDKEALQELLDMLTINESYFFREMAVIDEMVRRIMMQSGKIRILCAPSSSGEESFSIVMTLLKSGKLASDIEVIGIDINGEVIKMAEDALYTKRRVHRVSENDLDCFFRPEDDCYRLKDEVRRCATFKKLNIFDQALLDLGKFDIIFSRNMLIYFDQGSSNRAEKVFYDALNPGGYLLVGHADFIGNEVGFKKELFNGHSFYQK